MKFNLFVVLLMIAHLKDTKGLQCQERNTPLALIEGRNCDKSCTPGDYQCPIGRKCVCDGICGYSCVLPKGIKCYDGLTLTSNGEELINSLQVKQCPSGDVCVYLEVTAAVTAFALSARATYGKCLPVTSCIIFNCKPFQNYLKNSMSARIERCQLNCCGTSLCNAPRKASTPVFKPQPMPSPKGRINCYTGMTTITNESIEGFQPAVLCKPGEVCFDFETTASIYKDGIPYEGFVTYGGCSQPYPCALLTCKSMQHLLPNTIAINFKNCKADCCNADKCNLSQRSTSPSPLTTVAPKTSTTHGN